MATYTPKKYWRIAYTPDQGTPRSTGFVTPENIAAHTSPPKVGEGILLASYDEQATTGLVNHLGIVTAGVSSGLDVEWRPVHAEIFVDSTLGRGFWKNQPAFAFAQKKLADYGLHDLFANNFEGFEPRAIEARQPAGPRASRASSIAPERLNPIEQVGEPTSGPRCGIVYVLKSQYGYKVGRTRKFPDRMRAFGVHLPFFYTIPLCVWFDDHVAAEKKYHDMFQAKRINGEWFDLTEADVNLVRTRVAA